MDVGGEIKDINSLGKAIFLSIVGDGLSSLDVEFIKNLNSFILLESVPIFLNKVVSFFPLKPHVQQL
jgi:hypothetical protein